MWALRIVITLFGFYFFIINQEANYLFDNKEAQLYKVADKQCKRSRGGSFIEIHYKEQLYKVEYYGKKCFDVEIGENVPLFFDEKNKTFHVPDSTVNERYAYGCLFLLIMTFIPWKKLSKR